MTVARSRTSALNVGAGILLTRVLGFVRVRVFAHYFGSGTEADAFTAALKIPNIIRNLVGEGTFSASFIPVYAGLVQQGEDDAARRLAHVMASVIVVVAVIAAAAGVVLAPIITDVVAPGFSGEGRALTVSLVRIMFPMAGVFVLAGWTLGILNTHRRFFLPYAAGALWNITQIVTLVAAGSWLAGWRGSTLVIALAWSALGGAILQLAVQLPASLALLPTLRFTLGLRAEPVRRVLRAWGPVVMGAGVWQISSVIDTQLGSLAGPGGVAYLGYAQLLVMLPISLFGVSIAAASLPELSREAALATPEATRDRLADAMTRVAYFVVPSAVALVAFGDQMVAFVYETGSFDAAQGLVVAAVIAAYGIGVPAQGVVRLLASGHYALGDTRTPFRVAGVTVVVGAGAAIALLPRFGVAGIALGSAMAAHVNVVLNYRALARRTGPIVTRAARRGLLIVVAGAAAGGAAAGGVGRLTAGWHPLVGPLVTLGAFAAVYLSVTWLLEHPEIRRRR